MKIRNLDIRAAAKESGVRLWEIADELGILDVSFSRKLRKELSAEEKTKIYAIISRLSDAEGGERA